jgi:hypothetical protein
MSENAWRCVSTGPAGSRCVLGTAHGGGHTDGAEIWFTDEVRRVPLPREMSEVLREAEQYPHAERRSRDGLPTDREEP